MRRLGLIGVRGQAALWAKASAGTQWKTLLAYHPDPGRQDRAAGFPQTSRFSDLVRTCDAIVVSSPTPTHLDYLVRLSSEFRGPVLVEKPIVATAEECGRLISSVPPRFFSRLFTAQNWRFYPWVAKIREAIAGHPVLAAELHLTHDLARKPAYAGSWRSRKKTHPIGPMETQGIHWIDLVHHLLGPIEWVSGRTVRLAGRGTAPDTGSMLLRTQAGTACTIHASYSAPVAYYGRFLTPEQILVYRNGTLTQERARVPVRAGRSRPSPAQTLFSADPERLLVQPLRDQLVLLSRLEKSGPGNGLISAWEGLANTAVLSAFERSARTERPVSLREIPLYRLCRARLRGRAWR